jgi:hypothetical protein
MMSLDDTPHLAEPHRLEDLVSLAGGVREIPSRGAANVGMRGKVIEESLPRKREHLARAIAG